MYFLQLIDSYCGPLMCFLSATCNRKKGMKDVNVWQIPFKTQFYNFLLTLHDKMMCPDCIVFCYWFCMALAIYGLTEAVNEFFWTYRRNLKFCGALSHIFTSTFFVLGLLGLQDELMFPWVILVGSIILEVFFSWTFIAAGEPNTQKPMLSLIFLLYRLAISLHMIMTIRNWNHHKKNPPAVQTAIKNLTSQKFFVISYWLNIVFAVIGIGEALKELYRILSTPNYQSKIFGSREINCVSLKNQRLLRIVGLLSNIALLLMFIYGVITFRPQFISLWIFSQKILVMLEIIITILTAIISRSFKPENFFFLIFMILRIKIASYTKTEMIEALTLIMKNLQVSDEMSQRTLKFLTIYCAITILDSLRF
ncbi:CLUMA_CG002071, isoform A [Clunio marinus]|uniref:CLUMA_CG002071, isoform A n=1 Tax=Clunio marinus TaxID=568069 RepID=A0A1J1HLK4_9DIPT|nr:CLUMA_CG002071, isoform A [Clunio marinus]